MGTRIENRLVQFNAVKDKLSFLTLENVQTPADHSLNPQQLDRRLKTVFNAYYTAIEDINNYNNWYRALTRNHTINEPWVN